MPVDIGIWDQYRLSEVEGVLPSLIYNHHFRQVEIAEQMGFDQYYVIEHQSSFLGSVSSPSVLLSALSQRTSTIRLGAMIWQLPFHNPMHLAQEVATLDQLSNGRVEFGTGLGVHEHEFLRWNLDFEARQEMSEESLEIILKAWTEPEVTYHGKYWQFDEAFANPRPYQQPHPPIWAGVHSKRAIRFAAEHGFQMAQNIDTDEDVADKLDYFREVWREGHGDTPPPKTFLMRAVFVADTDEKAHEIARPYIQNMYSLGRERLLATRIGTGTSQYLTGPNDTDDNKARREVFASVRNSYDYALENGIAVVGSPDTVAKKIREQVERCGLDVYCCEFHIGAMDPAVIDASMMLFGRQVIPQLKSTT